MAITQEQAKRLQHYLDQLDVAGLDSAAFLQLFLEGVVGRASAKVVEKDDGGLFQELLLENATAVDTLMEEAFQSVLRDYTV